ncbi:MAG: AAA family ATPase [Methanobrevibacter sp.]|uniref:AAA family ATPase n=1 Tax=Methanobrevibacter sp. TaxID=66852 RepID=UPI0025D634B6|nr:AAA family ATPase [Methanobrevibacter sp.]MBR0270829.1 AAA family ATPase [Methanobrevibacter sp.]
MDNQYDISAKKIRNYLDENNLGNYEQEEYELKYEKFYKKFSPEILEKLEGKDVLNYIFLHDGDKNNLCYYLEFSKEISGTGGISGGSASKYSLFKHRKTNQWTIGPSTNMKSITEDEAIDVAIKIRDALINGANFIRNFKLNTIDDYSYLEDKLTEIFEDCDANPTHSWIHKYYVLLFPDQFPIVHNMQMKREFLSMFGINPLEGYYVNDGQLYELSEKADIKFYSLFKEDIVDLFPKDKFFKNNSDDDEGIGDSDVKTVKYWLISPGESARLWNEFYNEGIIGIGMSGTGDLSKYNNKEEIKLKFQDIFNDKSSHMHDVHASWQFVHEMQIGDIVFAKQGMGKIIGRGIIESDYEYDTTRSYHNIRKVKWTNKGDWVYDYGKLPMKTLTDITNYYEMLNNIKELIGEEGNVDDIEEISYPTYSPEKFLDEVYITEDDYATLVELLINKKNLIVQGAPGVGKTFMAKRLAYSIMGEKDINRVMMVQFHQSYSYEDFVMGYRPSKEGFELRQGSFYKFCKKAEVDDENDYFFIIDEINRGNLSKIFGELFMLIENDKRGPKNKIQLLYSDESFFIPKNVHIIGLMNTADRSLAMIDYALRRRFAFFDLKPGFDSEGFKNYQSELSDDGFDNLIKLMGELNREISDDESLGEGFRIGHSYLCNIRDDVDEKLKYIVEYELIPLLKEYWFDEKDKVEYWSGQLRSVVDDSL